METKIDRRKLSENKIGIVGAKKKDQSNKVVPVTAYVVQSHIDSLGGIEIAREIAKKALLRAKRTHNK